LKDKRVALPAKIVGGQNVLRARSKTNDFTGQKINSLTVLELVEVDRQGNNIWLCKCDCGKFHKTKGSNLKWKKIASCGCKRRDFARSLATLNTGKIRSDQKESLIVSRFKECLRQAILRGLSFEIDLDFFKSLIFKECFYCGEVGSKIVKNKNKTPFIITINGIDRVDSSIGYTKENCVPCCKYCNVGKGTMSKNHFIYKAKQIARKNEIKRIEENCMFWAFKQQDPKEDWSHLIGKKHMKAAEGLAFWIDQ
jgi:hypothetical protein